MNKNLINEILENVGLEALPEDEEILIRTKTIQEILNFILTKLK